MPRPAPPLAALILPCLALPTPAAAEPEAVHPALARLVPLVEVYDARRPGAPGYDVAAIRCAALTFAQDEHAARTSGLPRPAPAALQEARAMLAGAEADRRQRLRQPPARAAASTRADVGRVVGLYLAQFARNAGAGRHPWQGDDLIGRDMLYCGFLNGRR